MRTAATTRGTKNSCSLVPQFKLMTLRTLFCRGAIVVEMILHVTKRSSGRVAVLTCTMTNHVLISRRGQEGV